MTNNTEMPPVEVSEYTFESTMLWSNELIILYRNVKVAVGPGNVSDVSEPVEVRIEYSYCGIIQLVQF